MRRIAEKSALFVNMTVTTARSRLARLLEPRAPLPAVRLATVKQCARRDFGGVFRRHRFLPGITGIEKGIWKQFAEAAT